MAKHCPRCAYTTPDVWADECPFCLVTLARTRGGPGPVPPPAGSFRKLPVRLLVPLGLLVAAVILCVATGAYVLVTDELALGPVRDADSTGRVRVGMTAGGAALALGLDSPGDDFTGRLVSQRKGRLLRVTCRGGRVTGVEEGRPLPPLGRVERAETHYHN